MVLQALYHTRPLRSALLDIRSPPGRVLPHLQKVFALLAASSRAAITPASFHYVLERPFSDHDQQDASEFWRYILPTVESELKHVGVQVATRDAMCAVPRPLFVR